MGLIENLNKCQKKDLLENYPRRPFIIINPIFENYIESDLQNARSGYNISQEQLINNVNRRYAIVSDKLSIGYIE